MSPCFCGFLLFCHSHSCYPSIGFEVAFVDIFIVRGFGREMTIGEIAVPILPRTLVRPSLVVGWLHLYSWTASDPTSEIHDLLFNLCHETIGRILSLST